CVVAFIAFLAAGTLARLLRFLTCEHAKDRGHAGHQTRLRDAVDSTVADVIVMIRVALDDSPETNDGGVFSRNAKLLGGEGQFQPAGYANDVKITLGDSVLPERFARPRQKRIDDFGIELCGDDGEAACGFRRAFFVSWHAASLSHTQPACQDEGETQG